MLKVDEIVSANNFKEIKKEWDDLLKNTDCAPPFMTHDWFECCIHAYGKGKNLLVLLIKERDKLIGAAPLWMYLDKLRSMSVQKIEFIIAPDTPFVDFIILEDKRDEVLTHIIQYLFNKKGKMWDVIVLQQWPTLSNNHRQLNRLIKDQHKRYFHRLSSLTPYISITNGWEEFLQSKSVKFRKTHRNIINRINKLNNIKVQCFRQDKDGDIINNLLYISKRSWKEKDGIAISSREETVQFFKKLTAFAGVKNWLFIWILSIDNIPIAIEYDLVNKGKVYALRADFDEKYKKYSPGAYLEYYIINHLFEECYLEYNTGPGMNTYKLHWTDKLKENISFHICNNNLKGWAIWSIEEKIIPLLKRIRDIKLGSDPST